MELDIEKTFEESMFMKKRQLKIVSKNKQTKKRYALKYHKLITGSKSRKYSELGMSGY